MTGDVEGVGVAEGEGIGLAIGGRVAMIQFKLNLVFTERVWSDVGLNLDFLGFTRLVLCSWKRREDVYQL